MSIKTLLFLIVLFPSLEKIYAQKFGGGRGDGSDIVTWTQYLDPGYLLRFNGGTADGYGLATSVTQYLDPGYIIRFYGSSGDGFAMAGAPPIYLDPIYANRFTGGIGDGYAANFVHTFIDPLFKHRFSGGSGDGFSRISLGPQGLDFFLSTKFISGAGDGFDAVGFGPQGLEFYSPVRFSGGIDDGFGRITFGPQSLSFFAAKFFGGVGDGYAWAILVPDITLPVTLSIFEVKENKLETAVDVSWKTESEVDNAYFILQKKTGTGQFITETVLQGRGNSTVSTMYAYTDRSVKSGDTLIYRLGDVSMSGVITFHEEKLIAVSIPKNFTLHQNFPNPFNPVTTIRFELPKEERVTLKIYNVLGQEIRQLVDNIKPAGKHKIEWDGRDRFGNLVSSGIYLYRIHAGQSVRTKKMMMIK